MSLIKAKTTERGQVTIASGSDTSGAIFLGNNVLAAINTPASLRSIATLTITHSDSENGTYLPYKASDGTDWTITLVASSTHSINPLNAFGLLPYIKLKGNTNASGGDLVLDVLIAG